MNKTQYEQQAKDIIGQEKNKYKWLLNIGKDAHSLVIREMEIKTTLRYNISSICLTIVLKINTLLKMLWRQVTLIHGQRNTTWNSLYGGQFNITVEITNVCLCFQEYILEIHTPKCVKGHL